jgi:hypothetical protein
MLEKSNGEEKDFFVAKFPASAVRCSRQNRLYDTPVYGLNLNLHLENQTVGRRERTVRLSKVLTSGRGDVFKFSMTSKAPTRL